MRYNNADGAGKKKGGKPTEEKIRKKQPITFAKFESR